MRNLSSIRIAEDIEREYTISDQTRELVDKVFVDLVNEIMTEDKDVIESLHGVALADYMNIELYTALNELMWKINEEESDYHRPVECPVCEKLHRLAFIIDVLLADWHKSGVFERLSKQVKFRVDALENGRIIN